MQDLVSQHENAALAVRLDVTNAAEPPLRLILGSDAYGLWEKKRAAMEAEVAAWRKVGESTAFEGAEVAPIGG